MMQIGLGTSRACLRSWSLAIPGLLASVAAADAGHNASTRYVNDRYGFAVDIPAGFVEAEPPANDDGRTFHTRDGVAVVEVWAGHNAAEETIGSYMKFGYGDCHHQRPDYIAVHRNWAVLSCNTDDGQTIYQKSLMRGRGEDAIFKTIRISYPSAQRATWDPIAVVASRSIVPAVPQ